MSIKANPHESQFSTQTVRLRATSVAWNTTRTVWFGCKTEISKVGAETKTISKSLVEREAEKLKRLEKAHVHAHNKVESNKTLAQNIELHKREILLLTREIERVIQFQELAQKSALKIQKVARGYLVRKGLEIVSII